MIKRNHQGDTENYQPKENMKPKKLRGLIMANVTVFNSFYEMKGFIKLAKRNNLVVYFCHNKKPYFGKIIKIYKDSFMTENFETIKYENVFSTTLIAVDNSIVHAEKIRQIIIKSNSDLFRVFSFIKGEIKDIFEFNNNVITSKEKLQKGIYEIIINISKKGSEIWIEENYKMRLII